MFDSADILNLGNPQNILFKAVYVEKKLLKHHIRDVSIISIITKLQASSIQVRMGGFAVLGLSKILVRKFRYLLEDCNEVVYLICHSIGGRSKHFRSLPAKGITLNLELENLYIDDEMIDPEEFVILPEAEDREDAELQIGMGIEGPDFDGFNDMSYVEQIRLDSADATRVSAMTDITQIQLTEPKEKRRRVVVDLDSEFDPQRFRQNLRNTRDIITHKESEMDIGNELASKLMIAPEILSRIRCMTPHPRESIEGIRNATATESYMDLDFQSDVGEYAASEEVSVEDNLDIKNLPSEFIFNDIVDGKARIERSRSFLSLLNLLGKGCISAKQESPYSKIECKAV